MAQRLPFLDRLRGLATLVMLEVHVVNALLLPARQQGTVWTVVNFMNGLVAPAFLACAGMGFAVGLGRGGSPLGRLRRAAEILLWGYALHSTELFWHGVHDRHAQQALLQSDILQVIGLSLALLTGLWALSRRAPAFPAAAVGLALLWLFATPWLAALDVRGWPIWLAPFINRSVPSEFPLFPWMAFALLGAALGSLPGTLGPPRLIKVALLALLCAALARLSQGLLPAHDPYRDGPAYALLRFAVVCLLSAALCAPRWRFADPLLLPLSRHSLRVYLAHIPLVYGGFGFSLRYTLGPGSRDWPLCLLLFAALALLMWGLAKLSLPHQHAAQHRRH